MVEHVAGFGSEVRVIASFTFPTGFTVTQFADDADPFDVPSIQLADKAMGLNGDLVVWGKASPIVVTINVIPETDDDVNLGILAEANRVGRGKPSVRDMITLVKAGPDGKMISLINGIMTDAAPASSIASSGRLKSKTYTFAFENKLGI